MKMTQNQISKLPKWAQDHIKDLQRERDVAVRELREWSDNQTESPVSIPEMVCTGERQGPSEYTRYVQAKRLEIQWMGIRLQITLREDGHMHHNGIALQWSGSDSNTRHVALVPTSFQSVELIAKESMR